MVGVSELELLGVGEVVAAALAITAATSIAAAVVGAAMSLSVGAFNFVGIEGFLFRRFVVSFFFSSFSVWGSIFSSWSIFFSVFFFPGHGLGFLGESIIRANSAWGVTGSVRSP